MGIKFEVIASGETYTNKAGEEKKCWTKIGRSEERRVGKECRL